MIDAPQPAIKRRMVDEQRFEQAVSGGLHPILSNIIAARPFDPNFSPTGLLSSTLKDLDDPHELADIEPAVRRIVHAMNEGEVIGIETDHDCDGQTSHAVIYETLVTYLGYPKEKVQSYIGHRLKEGYGLSSALTDRILQADPKPTLIITADNGSSDEISINRLKQHDIDVIVTDHHEIPIEGIPKSAIAVINPTRQDCNYPDRFIAGCMVAWLLMAALRAALLRSGYSKDLPKLGGILDFVAVGTIADCVSIAKSRNNRIVVNAGLQLISQYKRPCWQALRPMLSHPIRSEDLGFKIGPLLNSDGRLACAFGSVSFLLAADLEEAHKWVAHLQEMNVTRKKIQQTITELGIRQAQEQYMQGKSSLCLMMDEGHAGVHGISASRIKDLYGRPTIIFCPKDQQPDILTGSARSVPGCHIKDTLQQVYDSCPDIIEKFGGHEGAAGLTIKREGLLQFSEQFEKMVKANVASENIGPVIWTDGHLAADYLSLDFIKQMMGQLEPFGREFDPPIFEAEVDIVSVKEMGEKKNHARLGLSLNGLWLEGVWFFCRQDQSQAMPISQRDRAKIVYEPKVEYFRGNSRLVCLIRYCSKL